MKYRRLGRAGFKVSEIGHGLWGMGGWKDSNDDESRKALQQSAELGCNFFDSAWAYGEGKCDRLLGELLRNNPGLQLYAASKIPPKNLRWPAIGTDRYEDVFPTDHVMKYTEMIRQALGVVTIDLLQFHVWHDNWASNPNFIQTIDHLKAEGLIKSFGLSLNRWEPKNGTRALLAGCVDVVQVIYNIFDQSPEDDLFPICKRLNIGVIARVPLDEGSLAGKLTPTTTFPEGDWRSTYFNPENLVQTLARVDVLKALTPPTMTLPEMALRFTLANSLISTTIVGMRKPEHIRKNIEVSDGRVLKRDLVTTLRKHRWDRTPQEWSK